MDPERDPPRMRDVKQAETYKRWMKLHICELACLVTFPAFEAEHTFFLRGHPVRYVYVVGAVTAIEESEKATGYTIDDGSGGSIKAVGWKGKVKIKGQPPSLNSTVKVKGEPEQYHGELQLRLLSIEDGISLQDQIKFWGEANENHTLLLRDTKMYPKSN